ncbi:MAG: hypothetical protein GTO22_07725 [Gemmatimonadales bacterium]|nr:hypothetical protein [Gemmatimonadales bacterium]
MQFTVEPGIFEAFPAMRIVVAIAKGVDNTATYPVVQSQWQAAWDGAREASRYGNSQSHPHVRPWRDALQQLGVSGKKFPSSIEALLRRAMKGGPPFSINPLVDFYNAVSLRHVVPAGGFDISDLRDVLTLRFTRSGDTFQALDEDSPSAVPPGEVAYATDSTVLTRHFVWRQARTALIRRETRDIVLVSEILGALPQTIVDSIEAEFRQGVESTFQVDCETYCIDAEHLTVSW